MPEDVNVPTHDELGADPVLLAARDQARAALEEITPADTIGAEDGHEVHEAHVLTLLFECRLPGYPGWRWAATLARVDETAAVTVLEVELLPGPGAVTAPEWVPWSERLAQYRETQARQAQEDSAADAAAAAELGDEDDDELMDNDYNDFDDELDGVDIDELSAHDDDDVDEDSDEDRTDESDETELFDDDPDDLDDDTDDEDGDDRQ
ncbi:DUF3027 domain-containing protein [Leucobacter chromiireducens]|uniref:DUF3027 domain-containing protein n=1 Tax=Leucobacter chromiireducens subsp. solipictus TaxID=398235 RepID=A0ABS1SFU1_9MICO|nr:DUF3027 domain-containing protein [Leucobacter chromiireducens]MBL3678736.1 DUF3027 domain-containing protein [Leucobacter chromiireducens subsp. solipictus]